MICIGYTANAGRHELVIQGHALYNPGNDIVCAGISAITYTLLGFLSNCDAKYAHRVDSGDCAIRCERTQQTDTAFEMAMIGYMQIARSYPDHVTVSAAEESTETIPPPPMAAPPFTQGRQSAGEHCKSPYPLAFADPA